MSNNNKGYILLGIRSGVMDRESNENEVSTEILGTYKDKGDAEIAASIYSSVDTTLEYVTYVESNINETLPELFVMFHLTIRDDTIYIRSMCARSEEEPWLRIEDDVFEAFLFPEDKDAILDQAVKWYEKRHDAPPLIQELISPEALEMVD